MSKILYSTIISGLIFFASSCSGFKSNSNNTEDNNETTMSSPKINNSPQQSNEQCVFGVTIDRAMNSITIIDSKGDTLTFEYPDIEDNSKLFRSNIGDSITVKFITTTYQDSVTAISRGKQF